MSDKKKLRRVLGALSNLRQDTRSIVPMETYHGMGNVLIRTYSAIQKSVSDIVDDPFIDALVIDLPEDVSERQIAMQISVLTGQLLPYVESIYEEMDDDTSPKQATVTPEEETRQRFNNLMDEG